MAPRGTSSMNRSRLAGSGAETPSVSPVLALLLLETMRDLDRPEEILEEEDISASLPRRLGLSEVVRVQIHRFQEEVRRRRPQLSSQVEDLVRLVIRRPDAEEIFFEAGRRVARRYWEERSPAMRRVTRLLPRAVALAAAQRAGRRMFAELVGPSGFALQRRPLSLRIDATLTARADPGGAACAFYTGALAESLERYTGRHYRVSHPSCGRGQPGTPCEWKVEIAG
jgi:hypothetical protein